MKQTTKIFIGLAAGIVVGMLLTGAPTIASKFIKPFGTLFINLIKMIIVPLVFSSLIVGASSMGDPKKIGRIGGKTVVYYLATTAIAITIGLILGTVIAPGTGLAMPEAAETTAKEAPALIDTLLNIVPRNPLAGLVEGKMLQIITFALFLGIASVMVDGDKGRPFINFFESLAEVMYKITAFIMELAPYGVFALIVPVVAVNGPSVLLPLIKVIAAVYLGCVIHAILVYSSAVRVFAKIKPMAFFKGIAPATMTAFSTTSSSGTLPVTIKSTRDNLGVSESISSFVLPLGATINMDGTALYQGVCALFVAQVYGITLTAGQLGTIILTATLASIGTAGVPGAGLIMLTIVLQAVGLPLEGIALIAGIDRVLDMARTAINVTGDGSAAVVIAATEGELSPMNEEAKVS